MGDFFGAIVNVARKDLMVELRTRESTVAMFVFSVLAIVVFNFALDLRTESTALLAPGILWVAFAFAGILGLNRTMALEKDGGCLDGLLLCPVDRATLYLGKLVATLVFMLIVELISLLVFVALFDLPLWLPALSVILFLGALGFASVGTLFSGIAAMTRTRDIMLPVLLLPIASPVLIAAVKATAIILDGGSLGDASVWLQLLAAFDVIFLIISALMFEQVIGD